MNTRAPALALLGILVLATSCDRLKPPPPTAKTDMGGKIVFSQMDFEDAKKFKTFDEFKAAHKVIDELVVTAPETSLKYYAVFQEPLNSEEYIVQVYDRTEGKSVKSERRDGTPSTGQATAGWMFAMPEWPLPVVENPEELVANDIWIQPGHSYEVVIMKPLARGNFKVADAERAEKPAPAPKGKGKKGG